jgi:peptidoglycan/LPS O-acetylase OafA/YrhL
MAEVLTTPSGGDRIHAFDAVRGGALLLGVAFHATMSFLPGPQIWVVRDAASPSLGALFLTLHMFRMILFFLVAGFFGRMLVERRGVSGFARNRAKRILLPLLIFWLPIMAALLACFIWGAARMNGGVLPTHQPPPPPITLATFPLTHLWFLYVLTWFYVAALAVRRLPAARADMGLRFMIERPFAGLLLAIPVIVALALRQDWIPSVGIPTPDTGFMPNAAALIGYGTAFAFGWLLNRQSATLPALARWWRLYLAAAVILTAVLLVMLGGKVPVLIPETDAARRVALAAIYGCGAWCWALGLLGAALRFLSAPNATIRYCADASYWIYLLHLPVVMALQVLVYPLAAPATVKFLIVLGGAAIALFATYHVLVRHSWLGLWLNGRRYAWRVEKPVLEAHAT